MSKRGRSYYRRVIEIDYFTSVMREDFEAVCACFTSTGHITVYHGDNPKREFFLKPEQPAQSFAEFYEHLFENYEVKFYDLEHVIDVEAERAASKFKVTLTPKQGSPYSETGTLHLENSNFFKFKDGKIADMIINYANPTFGATVGDGANAPTAYLKA